MRERSGLPASRPEDGRCEGMDLDVLNVDEATVTIRVLSVGSKRMPRAVFNQLPQRSPLNSECLVEGQLWGVVVDPKCCHGMHDSGRRPHRHVVHELGGELAVWMAPHSLREASGELIPGTSCTPGSGEAFVNVSALETHRGSSDFFEGKVFDLIRDGEIATTVDGTKVYLPCSRAVEALREARVRNRALEERPLRPGSEGAWPGRAQVEEDRKAKGRADLESAEQRLESQCPSRSAKDLYDDLVADVLRIKRNRLNYAAALDATAALPQLFVGA